MASPQLQPEYASIESQNALARIPAAQAATMPSSNGVLITKTSSDAKEDIRAGNVKATEPQLIARATRESAMQRKESPNGEPASLQRLTRKRPALLMTDDELAKAVKEMRDSSSDLQNKPKRPYYEKWAVPSSQWAAMDRFYTAEFEHSSIVPGKNTSAPFHVQVGSFNQRWALWASEIKDEQVRNHVINVAMETMERVWRHGIDVQREARKGWKRDKNDEFLNFEDDIETQPFNEKRFGRSNDTYYKVTGQELKATGVDVDRINTRIAARDVAGGEKLFEDFVSSLEGRRIGIWHWKARTDITGANIHGRDLYIYAFHEVQVAKEEIRKLRGYLRHHKSNNQKRNTYARIAHKAALINKWLAIAMELDNLRPKNETDADEESEFEIVQDDATISGSLRQEFTSPAEKVNKEDYMTPKSSATSQEDTRFHQESNLPSNPKVKVPFNDLADTGRKEEQPGTPLTPKTPGPNRLIVRLRVKQPDDADIPPKQDAASNKDRKAARRSQKKRKAVHDSDEDFENEDKMDTKRKKTNDGRKQDAGKDVDKQLKQFVTSSDKQISGLPIPTRSSSASIPAHSIRTLTEDEKEQREIYLREVFIPYVNTFLKQKGIPHLRVIPNDWPVIKNKLEAAGLPVKHRNVLLRRFKFGFQTQNPAHQPSRSNSNTTKEQESDAVMPATSTTGSSSEQDKFIITLRVPRGFNPASYSAHTTIILPGYRYQFTPQSTLDDRITYASIIEYSVQGALAGDPPNGEWTRVFGQFKPVVNAVGDVVADGFWDEFDGTPAAKGGWLFGDEE